MKRQSKCTMCKKSFSTEEMIIKSNKKYCPECFKIREEEMSKKRSDWDLLFNYICKIYNIKKPTGMMFQQLKQFRGEEYNYTDIGMYYTLKYVYEALKMEILDGSGLGIIPYYYDRARKHYNRIYDLQDIVDNFENTEKRIIIKTQLQNKKLKTQKPLSVDVVRGEDDETEDSY